ncbi:hypothetical protein CB1_000362021 [Camelus ferus]|nr:hypothetical protein CB1_000362021 [Camelus ferus]
MKPGWGTKGTKGPPGPSDEEAAGLLFKQSFYASEYGLKLPPAAPSTGSREIISLCPHSVNIFELHKLSEVTSSLFSGLFPNAREHFVLR